MKHALFLVCFALSQTLMAAIPEQVTIKSDTLYPEGVTFNTATNEFYVSSLRKGAIGTVSASGVYTEFVNHPDLISTVGLSADVARNRLIACVSDPGVSIKTNEKTQDQLARLMIFDINTKKLIKKIELSAEKRTGAFLQ